MSVCGLRCYVSLRGAFWRLQMGHASRRDLSLDIFDCTSRPLKHREIGYKGGNLETPTWPVIQ